MLSVRVHSPTEGVIGVKIDHFKHVDPEPHITLFPDTAPVPPLLHLSRSTTKDAQGSDVKSWSAATGGLTAEITENPYTSTFSEKTRILTSAGYKHQAIYDIPYKWTLRSASKSSCMETDVSSNPNPEKTPDVVRYLHSELNLSPGELIYGLGEQFGAFVKNGKVDFEHECSISDRMIPRAVC